MVNGTDLDLPLFRCIDPLQNICVNVLKILVFAKREFELNFLSSSETRSLNNS